MAQAVDEFLKSYPAIRVQHRHDYPAGRGLEAWQDPDGATWLKSLIVDDQAKRMVKRSVLSAYSIGIAEPQQRQSVKARRWEIYGGRLAEVSLVDSPSNARCGIQVVAKSAGGGLEYVGKAWEMDKAQKHLRKAAKLLGVEVRDLDAAAVVEKAMRPQMRAALESANPWMREMAREVLGGQA